MKIILFEPEIPQNTGNIIRTCSVTNSELILVKPLGFRFSDRMLKRSGLDYAKNVAISQMDDLESFLENTTHPFFFFSSKAFQNYTQVKYETDALLIFGSETTGLPEKFHQKWPEKFCTIPMAPNARCLNLANAVAIVLYEALRQNNFIF